MRIRTSKTATGKRLQKRVKRITPAKNRGLTASQVAFRKRRKERESYYSHERELERYKP